MGWDGWNLLLFAIAGMVAVRAFLNFAQHTRDELFADLRRRFEKEQERIRKHERKTKRKQAAQAAQKAA